VLGALLALGGLVAGASHGGEGIVFRHVFDDGPLDVRLRPGEPATDAVRHFHATGENRYLGAPAALSEGKALYEAWCQSCHLPDGSGRIGPSLIDDAYGYPRMKTDVGMFEIVFAGGAGAMQPFRDRLTQDQILRVLAYVRGLKR
jgi:cytochrome c-L